MANLLKAALRGVHQNQNIVSILYYGDANGLDVGPFQDAITEDFLDVLETEIAPNWVTMLPSTYTLSDIVCSWVNEHGIVTSPYETIRPLNDAGLEAAATSGSYQAAIISYQTTFSAVAPLNVKRSYLAYGPIGENLIDNNGQVGAGFLTGLAPLLIKLAAILPGNFLDYAPCRVGRTVPPAPARVGLVTGITARPFASVRKSRKFRPTGT